MSAAAAKEETDIVDYNLGDAEKSLENQTPFDSQLEGLDSRTLSERGSAIYSLFDPNYDSASVTLGSRLGSGRSRQLTFSSTADDSPYPEVRSAVANFDDPTMPASTFRAWVLGICWAIVLSGMNQFFHLRFPSVAIGGLVAQLLVFPLGRLWVRVCPQAKIFGIELNPGPFTIKEHVSCLHFSTTANGLIWDSQVLVTIMASVSANSAYATDIIAVQRVYYGQSWNFSYKWLLVMSSQLIGFSIGGIARRFLVAPPSMIWPNTLVSCALFNTLHSQTYVGIGQHDGISRERYFIYAFGAAVLWYFIPGYFFQALSVFSWVKTSPSTLLYEVPHDFHLQVCWAAPDNIKINQIFGYHSGLGFSVLTFDWNQIAFIGSPCVLIFMGLATLTKPFRYDSYPGWAEANVMIGFFFFYWFLTPVLYYLNVWHSQYMPISSLNTYDNTGHNYNVSRILNPDVATLNKEAYHEYSPLYLSTTFVVAYGLTFSSITSTITHAIIYFWKPIRLQFRRPMREQPDVHAQLMSEYPQVPDWYYACIFVITFVFACICIKVWPTQMPIWALLIALLIATFYVIPIGMIQAITNRQVGLNVITELIAGFMMPGNPTANMIFKTYGYITMAQALQFTADFKLGHYMKVPPRPMFWCQIVATIIAGTVQLGVQSWMFTNIQDLCDPDQKDGFTCASTRVFGAASIIWGVIGPAIQFGRHQIYHCKLLDDLLSQSFTAVALAVTFFFLIGAACPLVLWLVSRRYPNTILNYLNFPLIFSGVGQIPPATAVNYVPWAVVGFSFQYVIRRKYFSYWAKYNYVLSAALDAGTAVGLILVFFCLQYPLNGTIGRSTIQQWWGNQVYKQTLDWTSAPLRTLPPGETFG
ncbi:oligopeptide transporter [Laccaria bicolor S238N-H82]|uniref:Oligopeptide transporter n=1 Tax=Laccaria bicolor (strain S238N-H82 / ATCC MYA-4686) TaxID=486041 RepID=B0DGQ4_LACBS|nr:oligopeptide transporter [Laccaria bicolor S238N-H82]EDR06311.1 oligopeptide transporter [Laccaria bicolor S238N-H82]|eukprot:XP_001883172.1 oligopeptide transporter [Laccaria bicolor S238N-H82]